MSVHQLRFDRQRLTGKPPSLAEYSVAIGNFDGVHRGHQYALAVAAKKRPVAVVTFDPHPRRFFSPETEPFYLSNPQQKIRWLEQLGVQAIVSLNFDHNLADLSAQDFCQQVLQEQLQIQDIVVGQDFRFGRQRQGNVDTLASYGFHVRSLPLLHDSVGVIDSSRIRQHLRCGELASATQALGRYFMVQSTVIAGERLGRTLQFPTANLILDQHLWPRLGVYAVVVQCQGQNALGVASFGWRPTIEVAQNKPLFEVHLLHQRLASDALYGEKMTVGLVAFLREERKFENLRALKEQMITDRDQAQKVLEALELAPIP